jgi:putative transposase
MKSYEEKDEKSTTKSSLFQPRETGRDILEETAMLGFLEKLHDLLEYEIEEIVGRKRYERKGPDPIYRNGYGKERKITIGSGTGTIRVPRLRERYESEILNRYQSRSKQVDEMLIDLYLHGISSGDYSRFLEKMLGEEASLSSSTILRLKKQWKEEYEEWKGRKLDTEYLYTWCDGVYPKAGPKDENMAILVIIGVRRGGEKDILYLVEGYRESYESWKDAFKDIRRRGVKHLGVLTGDGIKGLWKAVREIYPETDQQRCWVHKMMNVIDKVPTKIQEEIREELRDMYNARNKDEAKELMRQFREKYYSKYPNAVISLEEAGDKLLTYFKYPKAHWKSIKTTNPIESCFSIVKLRTNAARRIRTRESAVYLIFKILTESQKHWRKINNHKIVKNVLDNLSGKNKNKVTNFAA